MVFNQLNYQEELGTGIGATIHDYGCAETDVASILVNCFRKDTDPSRLNQTLISVNGYVSNGAGAYDILDWTAVTKIYPDVSIAFNNLYPSNPADMSLIDSQLNKGCSVIVGVSFSHDTTATDPSHYVELYKKNPDGTYQCRDTWGGLDIIFDSKYAVNGMSVAQCILQAVSYNGPVQPTVDAQQIEDALRIARDNNWNLYQAEITKNTDLQTQLTACQSEKVTPTEIQIPVSPEVKIAITTPQSPKVTASLQKAIDQAKPTPKIYVLDWVNKLLAYIKSIWNGFMKQPKKNR